MSHDLKPCPFCSVDAASLINLSLGTWLVKCIVCGSRGPNAGTEQDAADQWNAAARVPGLWQVVEIDRTTGRHKGTALRGDRFVPRSEAVDALPLDVAVVAPPQPLWPWLPVHAGGGAMIPLLWFGLGYLFGLASFALIMCLTHGARNHERDYLEGDDQ